MGAAPGAWLRCQRFTQSLSRSRLICQPPARPFRPSVGRCRKLHAAFGWTVHVGENVNPRSLRNFPLQANGGEMLRLACCMATEQEIHVCCPVHDALLIEADDVSIDDAVMKCRMAMEEASRIVLGGFTIRTEVKVVRYPARYSDKRGMAMWNAVAELVG